MLYAIFISGTIICALMAMIAKSLLASTVWLAAVSVQVAVLMYLMGAQTVAVIELSVGAGLVTVLFVFAISTAGEDTKEPGPAGRYYVVTAVVLAVIAAALLLWMVLPAPEAGDTEAVTGGSFWQVVWQQRSLDTLLQIVLLSAGAMSVLGLITHHQSTGEKAAPLHEVQAETLTGDGDEPLQKARTEELTEPDLSVQEG